MMLRTPFVIALMGCSIASVPVLAQTQKTDRPSQSAAASVNKQYANSWRSSKLVGVNVYNAQNEKLGDINEMLLDKNGRIQAVVIGVGGFLGLGEHDVAVSFDKLKWVNEPKVDTSIRAPADNRPSTDKGASKDATTQKSSTRGHVWNPDHAILSMTKDQLKALPQFRYSDYN